MADDPSLINLYNQDSADYPQNLKLNPIDSSSIALTWDDPQNTLDLYGFSIWKAYNKDLHFIQVGQSTSGFYLVTGLDYKFNYYFSVQSLKYDIDNHIPEYNDTFGGIVFGYGVFAPSPQIAISGSFITTSPEFVAPTNLTTAIDYQNKLITVKWQNPITTGIVISGYRVYRADGWQNNFYSIGSTLNSGYIDSGVNLNQIYYYRVTSLM